MSERLNAAGLPHEPLCPELPAVKFTWDNYAGRSLTVADVFNGDETLKPGVEAIGWCDASKLQVRSREGMFALLFNFEGETYWFHVLQVKA